MINMCKLLSSGRLKIWGQERNFVLDRILFVNTSACTFTIVQLSAMNDLALTGITMVNTCDDHLGTWTQAVIDRSSSRSYTNKYHLKCCGASFHRGDDYLSDSEPQFR